ncbi:hypothetical protein HanXRQr2_Chr08g0358991 [Helianthus annuus]|uniref:Uncharacterized protein n=1 Tax=Helianthus annuus TaxID=4232 RepID=A0A9K3NEA8_HELAN|nr:hypothetical protein HanXRQr2_Chr08g0358991 [Helianthus annuus]KAJ0548780.1 hypothetical protein HanIR_Chr08g0387631 [Helianthus annuus]KAJ0903224.1 hypothetical protein HanPSC8_Chr08g0346571 [Helianthus annuus]
MKQKASEQATEKEMERSRLEKEAAEMEKFKILTMNIADLPPLEHKAAEMLKQNVARRLGLI